MADRDQKDRNGKTLAIAGGGALLLLLLMRGKGWGLGGDGGSSSGGGSSGSDPAPTPCRVRIDSVGIQLDGAPADLPTTVARCQVAGAADVNATGAAIVGTIARVVRALKDAGVVVRASPSIWDVIDLAPPGSP